MPSSVTLAAFLLGLALITVGGSFLTARLLRNDGPQPVPPELDDEPTEWDPAPLLGDPGPAVHLPAAVPAAPRRPMRSAPGAQSWPPNRGARLSASGAHRPVRRTAAPGHTPDPEDYVGGGRHRAVPADNSGTRAMSQVRRTH